MSIKKEGSGKSKYVVECSNYESLLNARLCTLLKHQSLVDVAVRCVNNTVHVHKCVLAASSPYFRVSCIVKKFFS